ncbi:MAG: hypothetical protein Q9207_008276 [Kuettlingeria erythrocarpa]
MNPPRSQDAAFFKLPIELRNAIYRLIVISPLSRAANCRLYSSMCVDEAVFNAGYFKRGTVVPLLQTCHQMHVEASSVLYSENLFLFQFSSLASSPLLFFDLLPAKYLRLMRKAFLLTRYFLPWPLQPSYYTDRGVDEMDDDRSFKRRAAILKIEQEGSKMVARRALSPNSGFVINFHDTVDMPSKRTCSQFQRGLQEDDDDEGWNSSAQLWKLVVTELPDSLCRQEFCRVVRANTTDHHPRQYRKNPGVDLSVIKPSQ